MFWVPILNLRLLIPSSIEDMDNSKNSGTISLNSEALKW